MLALCVPSLLMRAQGSLRVWHPVWQLDTQAGPELSTDHTNTASGWAGARTGSAYVCNERQSGILHEKCIFSWETMNIRDFFPLFQAIDILQIHTTTAVWWRARQGSCEAGLLESSAPHTAGGWKSHPPCCPHCSPKTAGSL